ncbi:MAG: RrF2 family transcriptional regulator [Planctomycetota bacterium]|jgi:Rrf2 family protein
MVQLLNISEAANLAFHTALHLARNPGRKVSAEEVAKTFKASKAHLFKVLGKLTRTGIVKSTRGPKGGYELAREPGAISLLEVYESVEGPLRLRECLFVQRYCDGGNCVLGETLGKVNRILQDHFKETTLAQFFR